MFKSRNSRNPLPNGRGSGARCLRQRTAPPHNHGSMHVENLHTVGVGWLLVMANRIELLQGTLDMLILRTLSWGPQHGYGIGNAIRTGSAEVLHAETGSLYPALHRLEKQGWVKSEWGQTENRQG